MKLNKWFKQIYYIYNYKYNEIETNEYPNQYNEGNYICDD